MGNCSSAEISPQPDILTSLPTFKVAIVGDCKTGKTAVFNRFAKNCYFKEYKPTKKVDIANVIKKVNVPDDLIVSLTLWDTPGKDDIDLTDIYFSRIDAAVVVVDVTRNDSMELAGYWKQQVVNTLTKHTDMSTVDALKLPILLLGNKYDLVPRLHQVGSNCRHHYNAEKLCMHYVSVMVLEPVTSSIPTRNSFYTRLIFFGVGRNSVKLVDKEKPHIVEVAENEKDDGSEKPDADSDELAIEKPDDEWHPPCVEKIAHLAEQHGFISGLLVSAKDPDGSIHQAMQTLLRNLIDSNLESIYGSRKQVEKRRKRMKTPESGVDTSLTLTGVEIIDVHIRECELPIEQISKMKATYEKTLQNFKLQCADAGFIPTEHYTKVTLEQCVTALKLEFADKLIVNEMECGMTKLELKNDEQARGHTARAMDSFNKELAYYNQFAAVCSIILVESEQLQTSLHKLDQRILKSQSEMWETERDELGKPGRAGSTDLKAVSTAIEHNRVQIAESLLWIDELYKHAERARDKVSTALMW